MCSRLGLCHKDKLVREWPSRQAVMMQILVVEPISQEISSPVQRSATLSAIPGAGERAGSGQSGAQKIYFTSALCPSCWDSERDCFVATLLAMTRSQFFHTFSQVGQDTRSPATASANALQLTSRAPSIWRARS